MTDLTVADLQAFATPLLTLQELAMDASPRQIHAKVQIDYTDPFTTVTQTISASGVAHGLRSADVADGLFVSTQKWFSLDHNSLDGSYCALPDNGPVGWWSSTACDAAGSWAANTTWIVLQYLISKSVSELSVYGDNLLDEYPVDFTIVLQDDDDAVLYTETVTGNTDCSWTKTIAPVGGVMYVTLTITKWSRASSTAKICEFFTSVYISETYEDADLLEVTLLEEMEYESGSLPIGNISSNEVSIKLNNLDHKFDPGNTLSPLYGSLTKNRKITVWFGVEIDSVTTWYQFGVFYSQDWTVPEGEVYAETYGWDRLELLRLGEFKASTIYSGQTLKVLAETVLADAGLTVNDYAIDAALNNIIPYAWFEGLQYRNCLKRLAEAGLARVYCDHEGIITMEPYQNAAFAEFVYDRHNSFNKNNPLAWSSVVNYVQVESAPRTAGADGTIYSDSNTVVVPAGGSVTKFYMFLESPCVDVGTPTFTQSSTHITITDHTDYSWASSVTFANSAGADENVTSVSINGKILAVTGAETVTSSDAESITRIGKQAMSSPFTNVFIQSYARAKEIADALLASYKDPRRDVTIECRGNILLGLGSRIMAPEYLNGSLADYTIVRQTLRWDGGLTATIVAQKIP